MADNLVAMQQNGAPPACDNLPKDRARSDAQAFAAWRTTMI